MGHSAGHFAAQLACSGLVLLDERYSSTAAAWRDTQEVIAAAHAQPASLIAAPLTVVAEYTMPTPEFPGRDFQVLHFDLGLPLGLTEHIDIARFTALYVDPSVEPSAAATRIVRLVDLAPQRSWPDTEDLISRLRFRRGDPDKAEGVLARIVEAADQGTELPGKTDPAFLCGLEFASLSAEAAYLRRHGVRLDLVEQRVVIPPGHVLIFDNLACAHGRGGKRTPGELHQLCLGYQDLAPADQLAVLRRALTQLTTPPQRQALPRPTWAGQRGLRGAKDR